MLILAAGGGLMVIGIVIAILNTYTEVFEDALKPEPKKKPKKTMDFAKPKDVSDNTPAKKFTDEVMEAYPNLLQVSAQITLGSSCSAQIYINVSTYNQYKANKDRTKKILTDIRERAVKHGSSSACKIDVLYKKEPVLTVPSPKWAKPWFRRSNPKLGKRPLPFRIFFLTICSSVKYRYFDYVN